MGPNRLGTNSLLDLIVFGRAAAQRAAVSDSSRDRAVAPGKWVSHRSLRWLASTGSVTARAANKPGEVRPPHAGGHAIGLRRVSGTLTRLKEGVGQAHRAAGIRSIASRSMMIRCCGTSRWCRLSNSRNSRRSGGGDRTFCPCTHRNRAARMHVKITKKRDDKELAQAHLRVERTKTGNVSFAYREVRLDTLSERGRELSTRRGALTRRAASKQRSNPNDGEFPTCPSSRFPQNSKSRPKAKKDWPLPQAAATRPKEFSYLSLGSGEAGEADDGYVSRSIFDHCGPMVLDALVKINDQNRPEPVVPSVLP